jgi:hypothetical protein
MADSALAPVVAGEGGATTSNENFEACRVAFLFGRRAAGTSGLVWGYYGGMYGSIAVADDDVTLTNNATNYVVVEKATGTVSASTSTTNWNSSLFDRLYVVVTSSGQVTVGGVTSYRQLTLGIAAGLGDTIGPASSTDNTIPRFDGTGGKNLQGSGVVVDDNNGVYGFQRVWEDVSTTTYTFLTTDTGKGKRFTNASGCTATVPATFAVGWNVACQQAVGAGQVTFAVAGSGTLENATSHTKTGGAKAMVGLEVVANSGGSAAQVCLAGTTSA